MNRQLIQIFNIIAQYLDVWAIGETSLTHKQRVSVIPDSKY